MRQVLVKIYQVYNAGTYIYIYIRGSTIVPGIVLLTILLSFKYKKCDAKYVDWWYGCNYILKYPYD